MKISPTALKMYQACPRKWAAHKLHGYDTPSGPAAEFGKRLHTIAEEYLRDGTPPPQDCKEGRLFASGMHLLPTGVRDVERYFCIVLHGHQIHGYIDYETDTVVGDHKTSSDPRRWGLNEEQLAHDAQAVIYGIAHGGDVVTRQWLYYPTRGSGAPYTVEVTNSRAEMLAQFDEKFLPSVREMANIDPEQELNTIPNRVRGCDMRGKWCGYAQKCKRFPQVKGDNK